MKRKWSGAVVIFRVNCGENLWKPWMLSVVKSDKQRSFRDLSSNSGCSKFKQVVDDKRSGVVVISSAR